MAFFNSNVIIFIWIGYIKIDIEGGKAMKKGWKVTGVILTVIIIGLCITNYYTSNPLAKHRAAIELETYLNTQYPNQAFEVQNGHYERKKDLYTFTVKNRADSKQQYIFQIQNGRSYEVISDRLKEQAYDPEISKEVSVEVSNGLQQMLTMQIPTVKNVSANVQTKKQIVQLSAEKMAQGQQEDPAVIAIDVDMTNMNRKDALNIASEVYDVLAREKVNYSKATVAGYEVKGKTNQKTWRYIYRVQFSKNQPPGDNHLTRTI